MHVNRPILRRPAYLPLLTLIVLLALAGCRDVEDGRDAGISADTITTQDSLPPVGLSDTETTRNDIVGELRADGRFSGFVTLLEASQLGSTFEQSGPFTFFAPVDGTYNADELLSQEHAGALQDFVMSHVVAGKLSSEQIQSAGSIETMYGRSLNFIREGDGAVIGNVEIAEPDIEARNGIIHAIDGVLWPES